MYELYLHIHYYGDILILFKSEMHHFVAFGVL